jgi:hypothetical protein
VSVLNVITGVLLQHDEIDKNEQGKHAECTVSVPIVITGGGQVPNVITGALLQHKEIDKKEQGKHTGRMYCASNGALLQHDDLVVCRPLPPSH